MHTKPNTRTQNQIHAHKTQYTHTKLVHDYFHFKQKGFENVCIVQVPHSSTIFVFFCKNTVVTPMYAGCNKKRI
jgi:hypothetical protein